MIDYTNIIHRTSDDSYVITKNGFPYHVYPYAAEFAQEWDEVLAYAEAHPECVTEEQPYVPPGSGQGHSHTHGDLSGPGDQHVRQAGIRGPRLCRRPDGFNAASFGVGAGTGHFSARPRGAGARQGRRLCRGFRLHHRPAAGAGRSA